jgi:hypothetical protein
VTARQLGLRGETEPEVDRERQNERTRVRLSERVRERKRKRKERRVDHTGFSESEARSARCEILSILSQHSGVYIHPKVLGSKVISLNYK